ncbi:MAG: MarR family transcriptional regulator, partial [Pusillimonas sp.]|nr:MarR family transcriptional regulator [Pusillimonas sp.]
MNALTREPFTPRWRIDNIGRLLNNAIKRFESRILLEMEQAGYGGFSLSHITITRNLDTEGTRATELARRAGITKQSMGEL